MTLARPARWLRVRRPPHWQLDTRHMSAWGGLSKRLMVGVVATIDDEGWLNLGAGIGPAYFGVGIRR